MFLTQHARFFVSSSTTKKPNSGLLGFKAGSRITDAITALSASITKQVFLATKYAVYLDLEKAFELANTDAISRLLASMGVTGKLHAWVYDFIQDSKAKVYFQGAQLDEMV